MKKNLIQIGVSLVLVFSTVAAFAGFGNGFTGSPAPTTLVSTLTNNAAGTTGVNFGNILIPGNVTVQEVDVITTVATGSTITFYDAPTNTVPTYGISNTVASYNSRAGYSTNYVYSFVGYNGVTNWYTNSGYWTYNVTNAAATNALAPQGAMYAVSGVINKYNAPMSFSQGMSVTVSTNTQLIVYYVPNK